MFYLFRLNQAIFRAINQMTININDIDKEAIYKDRGERVSVQVLAN